MSLNTDRGFNTRGPFFSGNDPSIGERTVDAGRSIFQQRQQKQRAADEERQLNLNLNQREREFQRSNDLQNRELAQQDALTRAQIDASLAPTRFAEQKFNTTLPMIQSLLGDVGNFRSGYGGTGPQGQQPTISEAPVYSEQQIQAQTNNQRAANDAGMATQIRNLHGQLAGRGFGSRSPLAMALEQGYRNQALATNTSNETDLRFQAANANSQQVLNAQKAREGQYASRQSEDIERNKTAFGLQSALLNALM